MRNWIISDEGEKWSVKLDVRDLGGNLDSTQRQRASTLAGRVVIVPSGVMAVGLAVLVLVILLVLFITPKVLLLMDRGARLLRTSVIELASGVALLSMWMVPHDSLILLTFEKETRRCFEAFW